MCNIKTVKCTQHNATHRVNGKLLNGKLMESRFPCVCHDYKPFANITQLFDMFDRSFLLWCNNKKLPAEKLK